MKAAGELDANSPGAMLRTAREEQALSPRETADRLCWRPDYVAVIESDAYEDLRNPAFAKGYVRSYGELLGLDRERLMDAFESLQRARGAHQQPPRPIRRGNLQLQRGGRAAAVGVVILLVLLALLWWWNGRDDDVMAGAASASRTGNEPAGSIETINDYATGVL